MSALNVQTILSVGVDKATRELLQVRGITTENVEPDDFEITEWLTRDGMFEAALINLDAGPGIYVCREIRNRNIITPVIGLASVDSEKPWSEQRAIFLEQGGDDLLRHPPNPREIAATLNAVTRRFRGSYIAIQVFKLDTMTLKINPVTHTITINERKIHLTGSQYSMLALLAGSPGRVLSKEVLLQGMYSGGADEPEIKIIDVYICKIRAALEEECKGAGAFVETSWGRGYRLVSEVPSQEAA